MKNSEARRAIKRLRIKLILARGEHSLSENDLATLERAIEALRQENLRLLGVDASSDYSAVTGQLKNATNDLIEIRDQRENLANTLVGVQAIFNAADSVLGLIS